MKNRILLIVFAVFTTLSYSQDTLKINTSKSEIKWSGEYAFYFGGHQGVIAFENGYFIKNNDVIIGGEFNIDVATLKSTDMDKAEAREGLDDHLKNEDFFDVKKFPSAKLVITKIRYHDHTRMKIYANLTIKEITLPIDFQAEVNYEKKQMTTKFKIDRTRWNINYNSKEVEGKLKDGLISDAIGFEIKLSL